MRTMTLQGTRTPKATAGQAGAAPGLSLPPEADLPSWQRQFAALMLLRDAKGFIGEQVKRVGPMFTVRALGSPTVIVTGHERIEWLLTTGME